MYDFANSSYTTIVITAVYAAYFTRHLAGGQPWAVMLWTCTLGASNAVVLASSPALGRIADRRFGKKGPLAICTIGCVGLTTALASGLGQSLAAAVALTFGSYVFYSWGEVFMSAFLPELAQRESIGRVSGWGWAWGYVGGMAALGGCLAYVQWAQRHGVAATHYVPVTVAISALFYAAGAVLTFALLRDRRTQRVADDVLDLHSLRPLAVLAQLRSEPGVLRFLAAGVCFQAGVGVAITSASIYAQDVMGFAPSETIELLFLVSIAAAGGALLWGHAQDRWGHRRVILLALVLWLLACALVAFTSSREAFWAACALAGACMGSVQSAARAAMACFIPPRREAEYYGLWAMASKLAFIVGPILYGAASWGLHDLRQATAVPTLLFVAAIGLLQGVRFPAMQMDRFSST